MNVSKVRYFDDAMLDGISREDLLARYRELRADHLRYARVAEAKNRSAILRMAGNIASGIVAGNVIATGGAAHDAVQLAREIVAEVDGAQEVDACLSGCHPGANRDHHR